VAEVCQGTAVLRINAVNARRDSIILSAWWCLADVELGIQVVD
jgi:hypothetical protein